MPHEPSLVILLLDHEGQGSPVADAFRRAGHRLVIATGVDTAEVVLGSLLPDVVVVRQTSAEPDREILARLERIAQEIPVRTIRYDDVADTAIATN